MFNVATRIALISDNEIVLHGLRSMLDDTDAEVSMRGFEAPDSASPSDLSVVDASLMSEDDLSIVRRLVADPASGVVALFGWEFSDEMVARALDMGCVGCFDKSLSSDQFASAMKKILDGDSVLSPGLMPSTPPQLRTTPLALWPGQAQGLTQRESEVMQLITRGLTNVAIGEECHLSVNTVKYYVRSAYRKIGVERRSQAVKWGMEHGMQPRVREDHEGLMTPAS